MTKKKHKEPQSLLPTAVAAELMPAEPSLAFQFEDITVITREELQREALATEQYLRSASSEERERYLDRVGLAARNASLISQVRVGMVLIVQKEAFEREHGYGHWGKWLEERGYTSSARRWMKIARAAADGTIDLGAERRLTGQQVLALLAPKPASEEARLAAIDQQVAADQERAEAEAKEAEEKAKAEATKAEEQWLEEREELYNRLRSRGLSSTQAQELLEKPEEAQAILSAGDHQEQETEQEVAREEEDAELEEERRLSLVGSRDKDIIDASGQDHERGQRELQDLNEDGQTTDHSGGEADAETEEQPQPDAEATLRDVAQCFCREADKLIGDDRALAKVVLSEVDQSLCRWGDLAKDNPATANNIHQALHLIIGQQSFTEQ